MQILIGCAKDMRGSDDGNYGIMTEPRFAGEAMHNALQMAGYDEAELADSFFHCIPPLVSDILTLILKYIQSIWRNNSNHNITFPAFPYFLLYNSQIYFARKRVSAPDSPLLCSED